MPGALNRSWGWLRGVLAPVVLAGAVVFALREPIYWYLHGEEVYDQEAMREWIREARIYSTLPALLRDYLDLVQRQRQTQELAEKNTGAQRHNLLVELQVYDRSTALKREEIFEHLKALGTPPTKMFPGQLPLFPMVYRLSVFFEDALGLPTIVWDSQLPRQPDQYRELPPEPLGPGAYVQVQYHLHAYVQRQVMERQEVTRRLWLSGLGLLFALLLLTWVFMGQRRERRRQARHLAAQHQLDVAERRRLEEEIRRQEAERRHQEAEKVNLELKSQLFANIGIMAGSYAHNIKNLLVRPNDLLRRCIEEEPTDEKHLLREVRDTLGTVTQRLQQILQTVRRDPSKTEMVRLDLNALTRELHTTWTDLARDKWKLALELELGTPAGRDRSEALWIHGDHSHLQQALENLLFNARDATFEMRNHLRDQARKDGGADMGTDGTLAAERRQALIAAAGWKGRVILRTRQDQGQAILEVQDNGIGMTEEVRRRCLETHFSTKRNNALFAGLSAGMGLGLSFVQVILEHHGAQLQIDSQAGQGALIQIRFPSQEKQDDA
jgi:signal transduction histidine kinase